MIRNIFFDWSGTLVDDLPAVWEATNHVFRLAGVHELPLEQFRAEFCLPFKKFYDRYTPHVPMEQLETWFHSHFAQSQHAVVEMPHARELLESCQRRGVRLFVLSTMHPSHFSIQCAALRFDTYFERSHVGILDKEARIRDLLLEDKVQPVETLMVGDMQHDIDTARRGGLFSCAVLTGYTGLEQLQQSKPDLIVQHLGELHDRLRQTEYRLFADNPSANR